MDTYILNNKDLPQPICLEDSIISRINILFINLEVHKKYTRLSTAAVDSIIHTFRIYMETLMRGSARNYNTLANIETELEVAKNKQKFDLISVFEIQANAKKLLDNVENSKQEKDRIKRNIVEILANIIEGEQVIKNSVANKINCVVNGGGKLLAYTAAAAAAAVVKDLDATFTFSNSTLTDVAPKLLCASACTFATLFSAVKLVSYGGEHQDSIQSILQTLMKLQDDMVTLNACIFHQFNTMIDLNAQEFQNYSESADRNVAYRFLSGERAVCLATKMLEETRKVQARVNKTGQKARRIHEYM